MSHRRPKVRLRLVRRRRRHRGRLPLRLPGLLRRRCPAHLPRASHSLCKSFFFKTLFLKIRRNSGIYRLFFPPLVFLVGPSFWSGGGRHSRDHLGLQPGPAGRRHPELSAGGRDPLQRHPQPIRSLVQVSLSGLTFPIMLCHPAPLHGSSVPHLLIILQSTQNSLNRITPGINKAFLDFDSDSDSEMCKLQN